MMDACREFEHHFRQHDEMLGGMPPAMVSRSAAIKKELEPASEEEEHEAATDQQQEDETMQGKEEEEGPTRYDSNMPRC